MENEKKENEEKIQAKKSNRGMKITIIVLIVIILALSILYAMEILNNDESSNENVVENYIDENELSNNSVDNNNNIVDENAIYEDDIYVNTTNEANSTENVISISYTTQKEVYDAENSSYTVTVAQSFAKVSATDSSVEAAIQEELDNIANEQFSDYKTQAYDVASSEEFVVSEDLEIGYAMSNSRIDENVVSVTNVSYGSLGGTSWSNYSGLSFDAKTGERLTVYNISGDYTKFTDFINSKISTYLTENSTELNLYETVTIPSVEECDWYLSDTGLTICFSKYQVSPSTFEYTISYSELSGYINDEYLK